MPRRGCFAALCLAAVLSAAAIDAQAERKRLFVNGEYLYRIAGCAGCHTDRDGKGPLLAGGRVLPTAFGDFHSPNITPDRKTGIGAWTDAQFLRALKAGIAPDGSNYYPSFPYSSYTNMRREDVLAIKQYIFNRPAVKRRNRDHALPWYLPRAFVSMWKWMFFRGYPDPGLATAGGPGRERGAYIVNALAHCGECHTPRNVLGAMDLNMQLAGTRQGPDGEAVPNITSDSKTGIGRWSDSELKEYLKTGMTPDGDFAGEVMAEVIDDGLKYLRKDDLEALVKYLRSIPKISNKISKAKAKEEKSEWD